MNSDKDNSHASQSPERTFFLQKINRENGPRTPSKKKGPTIPPIYSYLYSFLDFWTQNWVRLDKLFCR